MQWRRDIRSSTLEGEKRGLTQPLAARAFFTYPRQTFATSNRFVFTLILAMLSHTFSDLINLMALKASSMLPSDEDALWVYRIDLICPKLKNKNV